MRRHAACDTCQANYNKCSAQCYDQKNWYPICAQINSPSPEQPPKYMPSRKLFASYCDLNCWLANFKDFGEISSTQVLWHQIGIEESGCKATFEQSRAAFSVDYMDAYRRVPVFVADLLSQGRGPRKAYDDVYLAELDCMNCDEVMKSPDPLLTSDPAPNTIASGVS